MIESVLWLNVIKDRARNMGRTRVKVRATSRPGVLEVLGLKSGIYQFGVIVGVVLC